jgi:hypothetical protein
MPVMPHGAASATAAAAAAGPVPAARRRVSRAGSQPESQPLAGRPGRLEWPGPRTCRGHGNLNGPGAGPGPPPAAGSRARQSDGPPGPSDQPERRRDPSHTGAAARSCQCAVVATGRPGRPGPPLRVTGAAVLLDRQRPGGGAAIICGCNESRPDGPGNPRSIQVLKRDFR